jgi:hypothetical protein
MPPPVRSAELPLMEPPFMVSEPRGSLLTPPPSPRNASLPSIVESSKFSVELLLMPPPLNRATLLDLNQT